MKMKKVLPKAVNNFTKSHSRFLAINFSVIEYSAKSVLRSSICFVQFVKAQRKVEPSEMCPETESSFRSLYFLCSPSLPPI